MIDAPDPVTPAELDNTSVPKADPLSPPAQSMQSIAVEMADKESEQPITIKEDAAAEQLPSPFERLRSQNDTVITVRTGNVLYWLLTLIAATFVVTGAWQVIDKFTHLLLLLTFGLLVAFMFAPAVDDLQRQGLPRPLGILLSYTVSLVLIGGILTIFLSPLVTQLTTLVGQVPRQVSAVQHGTPAIDSFFASHGIPLQVETIEKQLLGEVQALGSVLLGSTLSIFSGLTTILVDLVLVLVLSFYFLLDASAMHDRVIRLVPLRFRDRAFLVEAAVLKVVGGYIRGQLIMALTIGVAAGAGCALLSVPDPLVIGLLAAIFELVPMLGPVLGALPAVLLSLIFQGFPAVLWVIVLFILIQQLESNVIGPRITGHAVGLHPLSALLALLVGVELGGILGALFAVPLAGVVSVLATTLYWEAQGKDSMAVSRRLGMLAGANHAPPGSTTMASVVTGTMNSVAGLARYRPMRRSEKSGSGAVSARARLRARQAARRSPATSSQPGPIKEATSMQPRANRPGPSSRPGVRATAPQAPGSPDSRPQTVTALENEASLLRKRFEQSESQRDTVADR